MSRNQNPQLLLTKGYHNSRLPGQPHLLSNRQLSWGRKGILMDDKLLKTQCIWKVGDGQHIDVSTHCWMNGNKLIFNFEIKLH